MCGRKMNDKVEDVHKRSVKYQYGAALILNLLSVGFGLLEGWASPSVLLLTSEETPLPTGKIDMEEASWILALFSLGALAGNLIFGYITNVFGRKIPCILTAIPIIVSWLLVWFAQNVYYLYAARLIAGFFNGGSYLMVSLFLSEIASDHIRGALISSLIFGEDIGNVLGFSFGNYFNFYAIPKFGIVLMITIIISFSFLPETPIFLEKQNKTAAAEKSIRFYQNLRQSDNDRRTLELEINKLKRTLDNEELEKSNANSLTWSDFTTKPARKAIMIGIFLMILNQFSGVICLSAYSSIVFEEAGSYLTPNMSSLVIGVIQLIGTCTTTFVVDRFGRKPLLLFSSIGTALGLIVLGVYMMMKSWDFDVESFNLIPVISFSFVMFVVSLGTLTLPTTIVNEIFPQKIKDAGVTFCMILLFIFAAIIIKFLPLSFNIFGFHGTMFFFAAVCLSGAVFVIFILPETKGKSYAEIMETLN